MSRIGKMPVAIPAGVTVDIAEGNKITVKGPKGTLERVLVPEMDVKIENGEVVVTRPNDLKENRALHGLYRSLIHNMVVGVSEGFSKTLELVGTGYRAAAEGGKTLTINIGYSQPVIMTAPENMSFETPNPNTIVVKGIDKQAVGAIAADVRRVRKPEPYHGKGIRYQGEFVPHKEGKAGKK